jgi:hypothetical protein
MSQWGAEFGTYPPNMRWHTEGTENAPKKPHAYEHAHNEDVTGCSYMCYVIQL